MTSAYYSRRWLLALVPTGFAFALLPARASATPVVVTKDPNCGCCGNWIEHLKSSGYAVSVTETADVAPLKDRLGVPESARSCHTAELSGYFLEGHVPAPAIARLLRDRPEAKGLAVPGMPMGAPGMEMPGMPDEEYDVLVVMKDGTTRSFMRFRGTTPLS